MSTVLKVFRREKFSNHYFVGMDLPCRSIRRNSMFRKRSIAECAVFVAITFLLFLFLHINTLTTRLIELEKQLQSSDKAAKKDHSPVVNIRNELDNIEAYYKNTEQLSSLNPLRMNNTMKADKQIVVFNRVPKSGSQTLMIIIKKLAERNNFTFHEDVAVRFATITLESKQERELAKTISELSAPSAFEKHIVFTNFSKYDLPTPIYVNMVRDPVERVISWFYYIRAPWYYIERVRNFPDLDLPNPQWLRRDFETCISTKDPECTYRQGGTAVADYRSQVLFFCGHDETCQKFNTQPALDKAKYAVEKQYSVVGVLEDMATTLAVFEKYIPRFFAGATEIYMDDISNLKNINRNNLKPPVSEETKKIVRESFSKEIEFYKFCVQRLYTQFLAANKDVV